MQEVEIIHARWAMLGVLALIVADAAGPARGPAAAGAAGAAAGGAGGGFWALWGGGGAALPWAVAALVLFAIVETYRMAALWWEEDMERRAYPGNRFDPMGLTKPRRDGAPPGLAVWAPWLGGALGWLAGGWWWAQRDMTESQLDDMKARELRNGRLAMVSFAGVCLAGVVTGEGPITLLMQHLADPLHNTILQALGDATRRGALNVLS
ncbi:MAG: hypothetical protein J3K34DRAFT_437637 [Monoraphidium minutum]|nr:MAG: hypothetical protein J3K34DRAFT_437637 [Monoraphidium minutum]